MNGTANSSRLGMNQVIKTSTGDVSAITVNVEKGQGKSMAQTVVMKRDASRGKLIEREA